MSPLGQMLGIKALGVTSWEVQILRQEGFVKLSHSPGMKTAQGGEQLFVQVEQGLA